MNACRFRLSLLGLAFFVAATLAAQSPRLVRKWETAAELKTPESVLFDAAGQVLYVSNIDGKEPWAKDGAGSIAKVSLDGRIIAAEWVKGLHAPKGLGLVKGRLYVADIDRVAVIDVARGEIAEFILVANAEQLNDVTTDRAGVVYVSDMKNGRIYALTKGVPSVWLEGLKRPNGVLARPDGFYVLDSGALLKVSPDRSRRTVVDGMDASTDGVVHVRGDEFLVSCWAGAIYHVKGGQKQLLLDTRPQKLNSADLGYDPKGRVVYVPTFWANTVVAYELK
jgi:DNA-binding beta-propeller fold protein YncE